MSSGLKIENNTAVNSQTIINIQNMPGNVGMPDSQTYIVAENAAPRPDTTTIALNNEFLPLDAKPLRAGVLQCQTVEC